MLDNTGRGFWVREVEPKVAPNRDVTEFRRPNKQKFCDSHFSLIIVRK
jgi:hypothetical protein